LTTTAERFYDAYVRTANTGLRSTTQACLCERCTVWEDFLRVSYISTA
jgi:hypothetical protein